MVRQITSNLFQDTDGISNSGAVVSVTGTINSPNYKLDSEQSVETMEVMT